MKKQFSFHEASERALEAHRAELRNRVREVVLRELPEAVGATLRLTFAIEEFTNDPQESDYYLLIGIRRHTPGSSLGWTPYSHGDRKVVDAAIQEEEISAAHLREICQDDGNGNYEITLDVSLVEPLPEFTAQEGI